MISHWTVPVFDRSSSSGNDVAQAGQVPCVAWYSITELADGPRETRLVTLKSSAPFRPVLTGPSVPARQPRPGNPAVSCARLAAPGQGRPRVWHVQERGRGRPCRGCPRANAAISPTSSSPTSPTAAVRTASWCWRPATPVFDGAELTGLRASRVDPLRGRIEAVEAVTEVDGRFVYRTPKRPPRRSQSRLERRSRACCRCSAMPPPR